MEITLAEIIAAALRQKRLVLAVTAAEILIGLACALDPYRGRTKERDG